MIKKTSASASASTRSSKSAHSTRKQRFLQHLQFFKQQQRPSATTTSSPIMYDHEAYLIILVYEGNLRHIQQYIDTYGTNHVDKRWVHENVAYFPLATAIMMNHVNVVKYFIEKLHANMDFSPPDNSPPVNALSLAVEHAYSIQRVHEYKAMIHYLWHRLYKRSNPRPPISEKSAMLTTLFGSFFGDSEKTPRTAYVHTYLQRAPIVLLDQYGDTPDVVLFQVSFTNPDQFLQYVRHRGSTKEDKGDLFEGDCNIQTLFSLGLRDLKKAQQDSYNSRGTLMPEEIEYLSRIFDFPKELVQRVTYLLGQEEVSGDPLVSILRKKLCSGYATLISVHFNDHAKNVQNHSIVAFNDNDAIVFFDPTNDKTFYTSLDSGPLCYLKVVGFTYYEIVCLSRPRVLRRNDLSMKLTD